MGLKNIIRELKLLRRKYKEAKKIFQEQRTLDVSSGYSRLSVSVSREWDRECVFVESVYQTVYNRKIIIPINLILDCWQGFLFLNSEERLKIFTNLIGWINPGERAERVREFEVVQQQLT